MEYNTDLDVFNEDDLKDLFAYMLNDDFIIKPEVKAEVIVNGITYGLRYDFVIKAKQHLIDEGFTNQYIAVEVKYFDSNIDTKKLNKLYSQCIDYAVGEIVGKEKRIKPAMCLYFTNLSFTNKHIAENNVLHCLLGRFNVARMEVKKIIRHGFDDTFTYEFNIGQIQIIKKSGSNFIKKPIDVNHYLTAQVGSGQKIKKQNYGEL